MSILTTIGAAIISFLTVYSTPKVVQVHNKKIALFNRLVQLLLFTYVVVFMIILKNGYQLASPIESAVITKIKGTLEINLTNNANLTDPYLNDPSKLLSYNKVWDSQDIVYPPKESNGFFLTTNLVITKNQTLGTCADFSSKCDKSEAPKQCLAMQSVLSDGVNTGRCVESDQPTTDGTFCEIRGWCPTELDVLPLKDKYPIFEQVQNFTVLLKNTVRFPLFNILRRNIDESPETNAYLKKCLFHPKTDPRCPIFRIGDILNYSNVDFYDIAKEGGVIAIQLNWNCNLDWDLSYCFPQYTFVRLDQQNAQVSPGYNFRYSRYNSFDTQEKRDLMKAYGIRFEILTSGQGRKFSPLSLGVSIGSGIGLLALATLVADFVLLYFTSAKEVYQKKKFLYVQPDLTKASKPSVTDSIEA